MPLPPIPASVRTSAAGFLGAFFGWVATIPGVPSYVAIPAGALSFALLGGGLVLAADHRAMAQATQGAARVCATCGRPAELPPPPAAETPLP